ncbi:MAG: PadR family transcriptional regulator [Candidatus Kariarchaeaceae archaeon]|jgi:DNA-binding PadR family transcriptional regulator
MIDYDLLTKWEIEYKKGFAKPLILDALQDGPTFAYNLTRVINTKTKGQINIAGSNIYPLLTSLMREELVTSEKIPKTGREPSSKSQMQTVYSLTPKGEDFAASLRDSLIEFLELIIQISQENSK